MPRRRGVGQYRFVMTLPSDYLGLDGSPSASDPPGNAWAPDDANWLGDDASISLDLANADHGATAQPGSPPAPTPPDGANGKLAESPTTPKPTGDAKKQARAAKAAKATRRKASERRRKRLAPRRRILPRTVIGICLLLLTTALAVGGISAVLYMNYAYKKDRSEALVQGLDRRIRDGSRKIENEATTNIIYRYINSTGNGNPC